MLERGSHAWALGSALMPPWGASPPPPAPTVSPSCPRRSRQGGSPSSVTACLPGVPLHPGRSVDLNNKLQPRERNIKQRWVEGWGLEAGTGKPTRSQRSEEGRGQAGPELRPGARRTAAAICPKLGPSSVLPLLTAAQPLPPACPFCTSLAEHPGPLRVAPIMVHPDELEWGCPTIFFLSRFAVPSSQHPLTL